MSSLVLGMYDTSIWSCLIIWSCCIFFLYRKLIHWKMFDVSFFTFVKDFFRRSFITINLFPDSSFFFQNIFTQFIPSYLNLSFFGIIMGLEWYTFGTIYRR